MEENLMVSAMDSREILTKCFGIAAESMKGDNINELFDSLRENGSRHIVDGLLSLFERYAEQQTISRGEKLNQSRFVYERLKLKFAVKKQEEFHILLLDNKYRMIEQPLMITKGTLNRTIIHPREIFAPAIEKRAVAIFLIHNHPSGDPQPSTQDMEITKRLVTVGDTIGISIVDHIIMGADSYYSFVDEDTMPLPQMA